MFAILGLASCKNDKAASAEVSDAKEVVEATGSSFDNVQGKVYWTGSKPTGKHTGYIDVQSGNLVVDAGKITGGEFILDMNTITCTDLDGDGKLSLEAHLKGTKEGEEDDFFNVNQFPTAKFQITKVVELLNNPDGNAMIYGNLTLKDVTKEIAFKATTSVGTEGAKAKTPEFSINRTEWGIQFMSKSIFTDLKDKFIDDEITLSIELNAGA